MMNLHSEKGKRTLRIIAIILILAMVVPTVVGVLL